MSLISKAFQPDSILARDSGYKRAIVAVAHKILVAIYHMLSHQVCYNELGDLYLDKLNRHTLTRNLVHRLERLGYTVKLEQKAA
jgi:transposase